MTLPLSEKRCAGRLMRGIGGPTLCRECIPCKRRTDLPADVQSVQWMQPPTPIWLGWCPSFLSESEAEIAE
jgi:hypothetical protein